MHTRDICNTYQLLAHLESVTSHSATMIRPHNSLQSINQSIRRTIG